MSFIGDLLGDITGANKQADAAQAASQTQAAMSQAGIDEQRRQFDKIVELMSPFVQGGVKSLGAQSDLLGLNGPDAQNAALTGIQNSPQFNALVTTGENAIRANASATGGLRGGNIQAALAKFRPTILSQLIQQQFDRLGGITSIGQAAAGGQANAGLSAGTNIAKLLADQGAAIAGGQIAQGSAARNAFGDAVKLGGVIGGFF